MRKDEDEDKPIALLLIGYHGWLVGFYTIDPIRSLQMSSIPTSYAFC
jgi:hypothetical protein